MTSINCLTEMTYWIAGDGVGTLHYGVALPGCEVSTGQPTIVAYNEKEKWIAKLVELGVTIGEDGDPIQPV